MPMPDSEIGPLGQRLCEGFNNTKAPYFGVNYIEVKQENWEAFLVQVRFQHAGAVALGGHSYMWSVRDYGTYKKVCWINYYPTCIGYALSEEEIKKPGFFKMWRNMFDAVESYEWFCTAEVPEGAPV